MNKKKMIALLIFVATTGFLGGVFATQLTGSASVPAFPTPPPSPTVEGKITDLSSLITVREKMIKELMKVVEQPARTKSEIAGKARAIHVLGNLRASEAASILVREINFVNPHAVMTSISFDGFRPSVLALNSIGKPASQAALEAIKSTPLNPSTKKSV